jgi:DNA-binding NtrC family response regulator
VESSSSIKVLVVDDEPDILNIVRLALQRWGYVVDAFDNPEDALAHFQQNPSGYSLALTDIRMPGMNGIELAKEMQKTRPDIRIMVMTAYAEMNDEVHDNIPAIKKEDIVQKPFGVMQICTAVRKQLGRQS